MRRRNLDNQSFFDTLEGVRRSGHTWCTNRGCDRIVSNERDPWRKGRLDVCGVGERGKEACFARSRGGGRRKEEEAMLHLCVNYYKE